MAAEPPAFAPDSALCRNVRPSPNHGERGAPVDMLLLHYTGMADATSALTRLCDPAAEVSAHYLIEEDGAILQLVPEHRRAWHAGAACWAGVTDINSCSIGIELVNRGHDFDYPDFPMPQIEALIALGRDIAGRWNMPAQRVLAHSDVAPARKRDPGEKLPWRTLAEAGLGHWVAPAPITEGDALRLGDTGSRVAALRENLRCYGYGLAAGELFDTECANVVTAFQRHFRPARVDGVADASTIDTLRRLLAELAGSSHP